MATLTIGCGAVAVLLCRADLAPVSELLAQACVLNVRITSWRCLPILSAICQCQVAQTCAQLLPVQNFACKTACAGWACAQTCHSYAHMWHTNITHLTPASAVVRCILSLLQQAGKVHRLTAAVSRSASQCHPHCTATPEVMITRAKPMRTAVEALFSHTWAYAQEVLGWTVDNLDLVVPHQVGFKPSSFLGS
jgi:hypothetical protein